MDAAQIEYLHNISELAVTFSATSALLTIVRQIRGGGLSQTDVYLLTTFMAAGFATALCAVLPGLVNTLGLRTVETWMIASGVAAAILGTVVALTLRRRSQLAGRRIAPLVRVCFGAYWLCVLLLLVNAALPSVAGAGLHSGAVTLSLAISMLLFVRRIATLGGRGSSGDWDLRSN